MNSENSPLHPIFENGHLEARAIEALREGALDGETLDAALSHIAVCQKCADAFAGSFDEDDLENVPAGFCDELQKKLDAKDKKRRGFALYVLRVALAACIALVITFSGSIGDFVSWQQKGGINAPNFGVVNKISSDLRDFSQNILNMEVFNNAQKKK